VGCLPAGEIILTDSGAKAIETIIPNVDKVIASNGEFQLVTNLIKSNVQKQMYTICIKGTPSMKLTGNHLVLVKSSHYHDFGKGCSRWILDDSPPVWKSAETLDVRDYIMYPKYTAVKNLPVIDLAMYLSTRSKTEQEIYIVTEDKIFRKGNTKQIYPRFVNVNEEFAELAGWYVAEGSTGNLVSGLHFCLNKKEQKEATRIMYLIKKIFNVDYAYIHPSKKSQGMEVIVGSRLVAKMFAWLFGNYSYLKKVPQFIVDAPPSIIKAFLKAYIAGDGYRGGKYDISFTTVSPTLSLQLTLLATKLGICFRTRCNGYALLQHNGLLAWTSAAPKSVVVPCLYDEVFENKKSQAMAYIEDDNYFYLPISEIKHHEFIGEVYDITTEDHSFLYRGIVHNSAIRLGTELPLADLKLGTCEDSGVQQHFEEQWDRINGIKLLTDIAGERAEIGNCYPFGAFNEHDYMWDQFTILNPDYVKIEGTWVNAKPLIKLIPDEALKKVVHTQSPSFIFKQLPPEIVKYVMFNQEIPLASNNVFHIAHAKRPYELRGRSIIKRILKTLMLEDRFNQANFALATRHAVPVTIVKIGDPTSGWLPGNEEINDVRDLFCYDEQTEVLTNVGFKKYFEVIKTDKIACFNQATGELEYHLPTDRYEKDYSGEMIHFDAKCMDSMVTPNHRMLVKRDGKWEISLAENVVAKDCFRSCVDFWKGKSLSTKIDIIGEKINTKEWFEFVGWYISEGSLHPGGSTLMISQFPGKDADRIYSLLKKFPWNCGSMGKNNYALYSKPFCSYVETFLGKGAEEKKIPIWMKEASPDLLKILFDAYIAGDGHIKHLKNGNIGITAGTVSQQLANDIQEIALKLGYACHINKRTNIYIRDSSGKKHFIRTKGIHKGEKYHDQYQITCSKETNSLYPGFAWAVRPILKDYSSGLNFGEIPKKGKRVDWNKVNLQDILNHVVSADAAAKVLKVTGTTLRNQMKKQGIPVNKPGTRIPKYVWGQSLNIKRVPYKGKVWCFTVPTGLFITRRNGRISIQGNSSYDLDPNFTLFYHYGIDIQFYGSNGRMLPVGPELDRLYRLKFIGLNMHEQLMTGAGGSYSAAYVNLEVQRQRYLNLQLQLETFYHQGVCKPVADLCGFYRLKQPLAGYGGVSSSHYGNEDSSEIDTLKQSSSLRDFQDNKEYKVFQQSKLAEIQNSRAREVREYVYPKLDWGAMNAATDENLKNWVKYLAKERPWLVDDATLARLGRLDRDTQEKAYVKDLERAQERYKELAKKGLLPFALQKGQGAGGADMSGMGDISLGGGDVGAGAGPGMEGGGEANAPIGANGPPEAANAQTPPAGVQSSLQLMEGELWKDVRGDDIRLSAENQEMLRNKKYEDTAILKVVNR
jgi:intein/homing endonuclease